MVEAVQEIDFSPIADYLTSLVAKYPQIKEIWLIGSRANEKSKESDDWDLLVFAADEVLEAICTDEAFIKDDIDLFLVGNNKQIERVAQESRVHLGSLDEWQWNVFRVDVTLLQKRRELAILLWPYREEMYKRYKRLFRKSQLEFYSFLENTKLNSFEDMVIRLNYVLESKIVVPPDTDTHEFFYTTLSKMVNECYGLIGCLKKGAYQSSYHQVRSLFELLANFLYLYEDSKETPVRHRRYIEYPDLYRYQRYIRLKNKFKSGQISEEESELLRSIPEEKIRILIEKKETWQKLWKRKEEGLLNIHHWQGRRTEDIFFAMKDKEIAEGLYDGYEKLCHVTHLSPMGKKLTKGLAYIGFPREKDGRLSLSQANTHIELAMLPLVRLMLFFNEQFNAPMVWEIAAYKFEHLSS